MGICQLNAFFQQLLLFLEGVVYPCSYGLASQLMHILGHFVKVCPLFSSRTRLPFVLLFEIIKIFQEV